MCVPTVGVYAHRNSLAPSPSVKAPAVYQARRARTASSE